MEFTQVLLREQKNRAKIYLYKKERFWTAYEVSAYLLQKCFWPELKTRIKKNFQTEDDYMRVGFVETSWCKVEAKIKARKGVSFRQVNNEEMEIVGLGENESEGFGTWKEEFVTKEKQIKIQMQPFYGALPVYKRAYDLMSVIINTTRNFPKELQILLGDRLVAEMIEINKTFRCLCREELTPAEKTEILELIEERLETMMFLLRLAFDQRAYGLERNVQLVEMMQEILEQTHLWKKKIKKNKHEAVT